MSQNRWFDIQNATPAQADVYLYGSIGRFDISATDFVGALAKVQSKAINLYVNSIGGAVDDGIAIFNAIKRHPATVTAIVDGLAASIASVIVQGADRIQMMLGSIMIIHDPMMSIDALVQGNAADMRELASLAEKTAENLDTLGDNIAEIYASRAGGEVSEWRKRMRDETWYQAQGAVDAGLADAVLSVQGAQNALTALNTVGFTFKNVPEWVNAAPPTAIPVEEPPVFRAPDPIEVVRGMDITPDAKRRAIARLKA